MLNDSNSAVNIAVAKLTLINCVCCQTVGVYLLDKTVGIGKENFGNYCLGSRYWTF